MAIAGLAVGATYGYIYVRSEYPHAIAEPNEAIARARAAGWLGQSIHGSGKAFDLEARKGEGSYIFAQDTSLLDRQGGQPGDLHHHHPLTAPKGRSGQPTH